MLTMGRGMMLSRQLEVKIEGLKDRQRPCSADTAHIRTPFHSEVCSMLERAEWRSIGDAIFDHTGRS